MQLILQSATIVFWVSCGLGGCFFGGERRGGGCFGFFVVCLVLVLVFHVDRGFGGDFGLSFGGFLVVCLVGGIFYFVLLLLGQVCLVGGWFYFGMRVKCPRNRVPYTRQGFLSVVLRQNRLCCHGKVVAILLRVIFGYLYFPSSRHQKLIPVSTTTW